MRSRDVASKTALVAAAAGLGVVMVTTAGPAQADVAGLYLQGQGEMTTRGDATNSGLGWRTGAHLLFLEAYGGQSYGTGAGTVSQLVLGPRLDIDIGKWNLTFRAGAGAMRQQGGALAPEGTGWVGRAGVALDRELNALMHAGAMLETETFALRPGTELSGTGNDITGSAVLLSAFLRFEIGL